MAMTTVLSLNPGSNSLKFDIVDVDRNLSKASEGTRLLTGVIDDIGKETSLEVSRGEEKIFSERIDRGDFAQAAQDALDVLDELKKDGLPGLDQIELAAIRVVHGGDAFTHAVRVDDQVLREIDKRRELAPLHNANALKVIEAVRLKWPSLPIAVAFDTAFHQTLPERAWRYPIETSLADRHGIRKFGFHGLSHRYLLEQYAHLSGRPKEEVSVVTMHLESGCSAAAIENGRSIETSMGFTPLEGLMMGTRSGSIDPAILPFLMKKEDMSAEKALDLLEKKSGLLGISGVSLDTRILRRREDARSALALDMFAYRVRQTVGAYLAVLASAQAIVFGGGIGENTPEVRRSVCAGLKQWGLILDDYLNHVTLAGDVRVSKKESSLEAWVIHSDEGMQLAYECVAVLK
jgi:acetate kinase